MKDNVVVCGCMSTGSVLHYMVFSELAIDRLNRDNRTMRKNGREGRTGKSHALRVWVGLMEAVCCIVCIIWAM